MINGYVIKKVYNEEILYLDISFDEEFAKLNKESKKVKLDKLITDYIKKNNIKFKGATVALMVSGMFMGYVVLNNPAPESNQINRYTTTIIQNKDDKLASLVNEKLNTKKEEVVKEEAKTIKENNTIKTSKKTQTVKKSTSYKKSTSSKVEVKTEEDIEKEKDNKNYITIKRSNGLITNIEIEEYVIGVVGAEMPASFNEEALKAQAIIARTYAVSVLNKGKILTDTSSTQNYKDNNELKKMWGSNYDKYYNKIKRAVNDTKGIYLTYDGKIIDAVYHSTSNGQTESAEYVWGTSKPYLVSVSSPYDTTNKSFNYEKFIAYADISKKLNMDINENTEIKVLSKTAGDRIEKISINNKIYSGVELRSLLSLRSADFEITKEENGLSFKTKGYGHGVGMSQYGANGMAKTGSSYKEILTHYYKGVKLTKM